MKQRQCPECGVSFQPKHHLQRFCGADHQVSFHRLMAQRGAMLTPLVQVSRKGKRGFTDLRRYALAESSRLVDAYNVEDKACGRNTDLIVSHKKADQWTAADRK